MLSLIGLPPLAGFFGKLYMFMEALNTNEQGRLTLTWLVLLALLNSVVSAFYYVRVLKAMFLRPVRGVGVSSAPSSIYWPIGIATIVAILFGVLPGLLLEPMQAAAVPMLSTQVDSRYATTGAGPDSTAATVAPPTQSSTPPSHTNPPTGEATARNGDR
jgi:NADH-quinone oxidoreductase subunit N